MVKRIFVGTLLFFVAFTSGYAASYSRNSSEILKLTKDYESVINSYEKSVTGCETVAFEINNLLSECELDLRLANTHIENLEQQLEKLIINSSFK